MKTTLKITGTDGNPIRVRLEHNTDWPPLKATDDTTPNQRKAAFGGNLSLALRREQRPNLIAYMATTNPPMSVSGAVRQLFNAAFPMEAHHWERYTPRASLVDDPDTIRRRADPIYATHKRLISLSPEQHQALQTLALARHDGNAMAAIRAALTLYTRWHSQQLAKAAPPAPVDNDSSTT